MVRMVKVWVSKMLRTMMKVLVLKILRIITPGSWLCGLPPLAAWLSALIGMETPIRQLSMISRYKSGKCNQYQNFEWWKGR